MPWSLTIRMKKNRMKAIRLRRASKQRKVLLEKLNKKAEEKSELMEEAAKILMYHWMSNVFDKAEHRSDLADFIMEQTWVWCGGGHRQVEQCTLDTSVGNISTF